MKRSDILKKKSGIIIALCSIAIIFMLLHSTSSIALRTYLFTDGHPIVAFNTEIINDDLHNRVDKQTLDKQNAKCYKITKPAFEKAAQTELTTFEVRKIGFLFFAKYYGEA